MRYIKLLLLSVFFMIILWGAPTYVSVAGTSYAEVVKPPDADGFLGDGSYRADEQLEALKKIVGLNVKNAKKIPVLLYHHLEYGAEIPESEKDSQAVISVERFTQHMKLLHNNGFYAASAIELEMYMNGEMILPERTVVITFDDGYRSNARYAYPVLKKYGFKASIFIITRLIGEKGDMEFLTWDDMRACSDVFSYHSHTHNMHKLRDDGLTELSAGEYEAVKDDLKQSSELLNTNYFAYPHGQVKRHVKNALRESGYRMAFGLKKAYADSGSDMLDMPRFTITSSMKLDAFEAICMGKYAG